MSKKKLKDILIDADVISQFIAGGQILILHRIFPNQILLLDKVYDELARFPNKRKEVDNLINFKIVRLIKFPDNEPEIFKEYLHIKKLLFKGDGESACLAYVRYKNDIIGSSNLRDVREYCKLHKIELLSTMDFLCEAKKKGLLTEKQCDDFIIQVLKAGSKLPVKKISEHPCS